MELPSRLFQKVLMFLALVVFVLISNGRPVSSFSFEYVDKPKIIGAEEDVVLYDCDSSRSNSPVKRLNSPKNDRKVQRTRSKSEPVVCKRVDRSNEVQEILSTNNFFVVRHATLAKGQRLYDMEDMSPLTLPPTVNVGVEFNSPTFPKLKQPTSLQEARRLLAKLKALEVLPYFYKCPEHMVNFLSISDINYVTKDSVKSVKELAAFVAILNRITKMYYKDYYRTFWMWFDTKINMSPWKRKDAAGRLYAALKIVLPKMIDPCLIMSHQTIDNKDERADVYCSAYCRALVVAADIFEQQGKMCNIRWGEGKCRNNKCICIKKAVAGMFGKQAPMHMCNNELVQENIHSIFYTLNSLEKPWVWTDWLMKFVFRDYRRLDECDEIPKL